MVTTNMKCTPEEATPTPEPEPEAEAEAAHGSAMLLELEAAVLRGCASHTQQQHFLNASEAGPLPEALLSGDLEGVLRSPPVLELLAGDGCCERPQELEAYLEKRLLTYLGGGAGGGGQEQRRSREVLVMALGVSCLQLFAQSNWTGPPLSLAPTQLLLPAALCSKEEEVQEALHCSLLLDGEALYSLVANPLLLLLARIIFTKCSSAMEHLQLVPWWTLRYVSLHQQVLEARSPQLLELACSSMERVLQCQGVLSRRPKLAILFHLECVYISLTYYEYHKAKEHIRRAQDISGLDINMTGALGKRTRFQHKYLAQLILEVKRRRAASAHADSEPALAPTPRNLLPKDYSLDDDTVLDQIALQEPDEYQLPELSGEEQAVVLGLCTDFQRNNPVHKLTAEELLAFTSCLLSQPKLWAVEVAALCLRTKLERGRTRCVERAMMQTQAVVDHFEDKECPPAERLKVFYCCPVPPRWAVQKQLASLMDDLGCVSSALLVYEKLELWEEAVICYERLGQHGKAEEIVRRELEKKERPSLYCLLGDILREHQYYERAWELSGQRSSRAMRSKALLHLRQKEFQQCVDCFELSLKVNAMQLGVWFSLGCAYLALGGYEGAARAFQRCVGLEPDNAEAWNNLSTAYIRLQRKDKAFRTLQEALKCNFEHWQIWENFLVVSTDIGDFAEAIRAYHRLMDLRDGYKDVQVLGILVRAVVENLTDSQGEQALTLRSKVRELMGRVSSRHTGDPEIWRQYAALCGSGRAADAEDNDKALHFLQKAHRCEVQAGGWDKEPTLFKDVIHRALEMGEVTISCSQTKTNPSEALQILSSSRLSLRSLATKAKQMHTDVGSGQVHEDLQESLDALEQLVTRMQELSVKLREQSQ